jgi:hypothetical protein
MYKQLCLVIYTLFLSYYQTYSTVEENSSCSLDRTVLFTFLWYVMVILSYSKVKTRMESITWTKKDTTESTLPVASVTLLISSCSYHDFKKIARQWERLHIEKDRSWTCQQPRKWANHFGQELYEISRSKSLVVRQKVQVLSNIRHLLSRMSLVPMIVLWPLHLVCSCCKYY